MWLLRSLLAAPVVLLCLCGTALAEGSAELDLADTTDFLPNDQTVDGASILYVDIVDGSSEKVCYRGNATSLAFYRPSPDQQLLVATLESGQCADAVAGVSGAYLLDIETQTLMQEWDIRVCAQSVSDDACLNSDGNERSGRLWSYDWSFQSNIDYARSFAINGSVYAIVPGGAAGRDAVIEMNMRGVSGARYHLFANSIGPETSSGERIGRSTKPDVDPPNRVRPQFPLYLNPPEVAKYNALEPVVSDVKLAADCGEAVVTGVAPGRLSFVSNVEGQYVVICDVNRDGNFGFADDGDFSSFGGAVAGTNVVSWDGKTKGGMLAEPGDYSCIVHLNVGEFHFVAQDIETADPGIRMFRVEPDKSARKPLRMFWDDSLVGEDSEPLSSGGVSPSGPPALGLDANAYETPTAPFYFDGTEPKGNARAWGNFDDDGKGNNAYLDQFTSAATAQSAPITVAVISGEGDPDGDGLATARECELRSDPRKRDSDGDRVDDGFEASQSDAPDHDGDGTRDILDPDDDGDKRTTQAELGAQENGDGNPSDALDTDGDRVPDYLDTDSDGDGVPDVSDLAPNDASRCRDEDGDTCDDCSGGMGAKPAMDGADSDNDGRCDAAFGDGDGDGIDDDSDLDMDNDGIPNSSDGLADLDDDGIANQRDLDSDGDGLADVLEAGGGDLDADADGRIDKIVDAAPKDGLHDALQGTPDDALPLGDTDADGEPDFRDVDDDGDGRATADERADADAYSDLGADVNGDGAPNWLDTNSDGDGATDRLENAGDGDSNDDNIPDYLQANVDPSTRDSDNDGLPDLAEQATDAVVDTDGDGIPDPLDSDDDGDGTPTREELAPDGEAIDSDGDLIPDYLDPDGTSAPIAETPTAKLELDKGTLAGGALCSVSAPGAGERRGLGLVLFGVALVLLRIRRLRLGGSLWVLLMLGRVGGAQAQVALEQYKPAPLASDGFALSRPDVPGHLVFGASLWLDYANDPLIYERSAGDPSTQERVVRDHLVLHAGASLGLGDRVAVFATLPVHLLMDGQNRLTDTSSKPEGAGLGDLALGARLRILGDAESLAALSGELIARLPTAELANSKQLYSGDAVGSYEPALIGELRLGIVDVRLRLGARLRKATDVGNLRLDQEMVYGAGARIRLGALVSLHAELYGSAFVDDFFGREHTPFEALAGVKVRPGDYLLGLAAGPGLSHGYGAPDVRIVATAAYAPAGAPAPVPVADSDGDGLLDPEDRCPQNPEDRDGFEDADGCPDADNDQDAILDAVDHCPNEAEDRDQFQDDDGCPDPDNDQDAVLDASDKCPSEPEDRDQFQDDDGCPELDNDKDALVDAADKCPNEPEDYDGFEDADGCPEEGSGLVRLTCERIEIKEAVYFDTGADVIQSRSFTMLDQMAALLQQAKYVKRVRVEGHTDNRGKPEYNLELSKRRAASVLRYLAEHGVETERLASEGYGLGKPIADNNTDQGRAANRRVEFIVVEQSSDCK